MLLFIHFVEMTFYFSKLNQSALRTLIE